MIGYTHNDLILLGFRHLNRDSFLIGSEFGTKTERPDIFAYSRKRKTTVVEVKISRADFQADLRKPHRHQPGGLGNFRFYLAPFGLLDPDELPDGWGLMAVKRGRVYRIKESKEFESNTGDEMWLIAKMLMMSNPSEGRLGPSQKISIHFHEKVYEGAS